MLRHWSQLVPNMSTTYLPTYLPTLPATPQAVVSGPSCLPQPHRGSQPPWSRELNGSAVEIHWPTGNYWPVGNQWPYGKSVSHRISLALREISVPQNITGPTGNQCPTEYHWLYGKSLALREIINYALMVTTQTRISYN